MALARAPSRRRPRDPQRSGSATKTRRHEAALLACFFASALVRRQAQDEQCAETAYVSGRGSEVQHHRRADGREHEAEVEHRAHRGLRGMDDRGDCHVHDRRAAEDERHHVEWQPSGLERPDDAGSSGRAEPARHRRSDQSVAVEVRERALSRQRRNRHEHTDREVGDSDAQERLERVAELRLPEVQQRTVRAPRKYGPCHEDHPSHTRPRCWNYRDSHDRASGIVARTDRSRTTASTSGEVAMVVASAIKTIIEKSSGVRTPRSRPILSTMSSINPRVFIRMPRPAACRVSIPVRRAATNVPPNLPAVATTMIRAHARHAEAPETRSIRVRMPANAKNAGSRDSVTGPVRLSVQVLARRLSCGTMAPNRNAPKIAWTPICSVTNAEVKTPASVARMAGHRRRSSEARTSRRASGLTTTSMSTMKTIVSATTITAPPALASATATTHASRHHAVTSSTAAHVRAIMPSSDRVMPRSARILASTGNAVIDMATPQNNAKLMNGTSLVENRG